ARAREIVRLDSHQHGAHVSPRPQEGQAEQRGSDASLTRFPRRLTVRSVASVTSPHEIAPGTALTQHRVRARNLFPDSANRIHDDTVARQHGFAGALVAGVTIYGYLTRMAVDTWGSDWLHRGTATVRFERPIYDGDVLTLTGRIVGRSGRPEAGETLAAIEARTPRGEVA